MDDINGVSAQAGAISVRLAAVAACTAVLTLVAGTAALATGLIGHSDLALLSCLVNSAMAGLATVGFLRAARGHEGRHRRVWLLFGSGTAVWTLGAVPYTVFIATGGSYLHPAAWTQVGYLAAYLPWLAALWLLSQRVLATSALRLLETIATEVAGFLLVAATVLGVLWSDGAGVSVNTALLTPVAIDLLLIAAIYNAVRRASFRWRSTYPWLVLAFVALGAADITFGVVIARWQSSDYATMAPVTMYCLVFALLAVASGRPLELRETGLAGERMSAGVAVMALPMAGPATLFAPRILVPAVWLTAGVLSWRVHATLRGRDRSDADPITGLHDAHALSRHLTGILAAASAREPVGLLAVDLNGFSSWNAVNGFSAGDQVLAEVAESCVESHVGPGVWGRIGPDRFCWVGRVSDVDQARGWAENVLLAAESNSANLPVRGGVVVCPADAGTAANALAAMDEALTAAAQGEHRVVAFDRGLMDGATLEGTYSASFRTRRTRIEEIIGDANGVASVFQPIVRLSSLAVTGHEALSRMSREPYRSPDQWIGEAHQVGLGLEMELECIRRAVAANDQRPRGTYMSVNASPHLLLSGMLDRGLPEGDLSWLVIEITEHEQVRDYSVLAERLAGPRSRGARVAVDDVGAGHSTLRHVMRISPDFAKLDRSMVEDIDRDPAKQALMRSMVAFSREMACTVVAEGVETLAELEMLRDLGVRFGQGYLFRRPSADMVTALITVTPGLVPRVVGADEQVPRIMPGPMRARHLG